MGGETLSYVGFGIIVKIEDFVRVFPGTFEKKILQYNNEEYWDPNNKLLESLQTSEMRLIYNRERAEDIFLVGVGYYDYYSEQNAPINIERILSRKSIIEPWLRTHFFPNYQPGIYNYLEFYE